MKYIAKGKNLRSSVEKARIPADVVRGMMVTEAIPVLSFMREKAAGLVLKVLESAKANAEHNFNVKANNLIISEIRVDKGWEFKRMKPRSRGNASYYNLHHCIVSITLTDITEKEEVKKKEEVKVVAKPEKKVAAKVVKSKKASSVKSE